ncbi:hypothetical protein ACTDI4_05435 [Mesorhizobium sp. PUT5]|uniref:hypothetical protein n=1 Tax=Mesorhizobium sp. PUT5 TaxID=3454629 RepID=UPI003FA47760
MPNNTVRADGEAIPAANQMNRRTILQSASAAGLAAIIPSAVAAREYGPRDPNHPWNRARHHARMLSDALAEIADGATYAEVYPRGYELPIRFGDISYLEDYRQTEIRALFDQWKAIVEDGCRHLTDAQLDERYQRYSALQDQIAALKPRTATEFAMQFYVATDRGESHYPDEFMSAVKALIGV